MPDVIIKNGTVIDGTGAPGVKADVGIKDDRIAFIGQAPPQTNGCAVIDATGKYVCPGIVDSHSHADLTIFREEHPRLLEPLVRQGITTFIGGNCGMSMAPIGESFKKQTSDYLEIFTAMDVEKEIHWRTTAEFFDIIENNGLIMNAGILAPHGLIRIHEMGLDQRYATDDEINAMKNVLDECMDAGCIGMSTGLQYFPGSQSDTRELLELGKIIKKHDGIYTSHLRSYSNTLGLAIDEIIDICRTNEINGQISHIFSVPDFGRFGRPVRAVVRALAKLSDYWTPPIPLDADTKKQLDKLDALRETGTNVGMDIMPTTTGFTHLLAFFPPWVLTGDKEEILKRVKDPETRKRIYHDIVNGRLLWPHVEGNTWSLNLFKLMGWECVRIMSVVSDKNKRYEGGHLPAIAKERRQHPFETACDLLVEEDGKVLIFESIARPEDNFTERSTFAGIQHPEVAISTDTILMGFGKPSYLFYGTYPKFIRRYVFDKKMLSLETAVRKMSGLPAELFALKERGNLKEGWFADVLVIDPATIAPNCTFTEPIGTPAGIDHVFINGHHILNEGKLSVDPLPGRLLRA